MDKSGRLNQSSRSRVLGVNDTRTRRQPQSAQTTNDLAAPLSLSNIGQIQLALDGALYVTPDGKLAFRTGNGLAQLPGSPVRLTLVLGNDSMALTKDGVIAQPRTSQVRLDTLQTHALDLKTFIDSEAELVKRKGVAGGYATLDSSALVPLEQLGTGATSSATVLRGDRTFGAAPVPAGASYTASVTTTGGGMGYSAGAGGTVTQITSKATGVTLNKLCGAITLNNANLGSLASATFVVTCSEVAAADGVFVWHASGGTAGAYLVGVTSVGAGSFRVTIMNISGGALAEAPVVGYAVFKSATS